MQGLLSRLLAVAVLAVILYTSSFALEMKKSSRHSFDKSLLILAEVDNAPLDKPLYVACHLMSSTCDLLLCVKFTHDQSYDN